MTSKLTSPRALSLFFVFVFSLCLFSFVSMLDPNPHHDGFMLAAAIATTSGLMPNRDFFTHYGPVTTWFHSSVLGLFPHDLISIRLLNSLFLSILVTFSFALASRFFGYRASLFASLTYILTCPIWTFHNQGFVGMWPWSSVVFSLFIVLSCYSWLKSLDEGQLFQTLMAFLSGVSLGVAILARPISGVVLILFFFVFFLALNPSGIVKNRFRSMVLGIVSILFLFFLFQLSTKGLVSYINDTVTGPIQSTNLPAVGILSSFKNIFFAPVIFSILIVFYIVIPKNILYFDTLVALIFTFFCVAQLGLFSFLHTFHIHVLDNLTNSLYFSVFQIFQHAAIFLIPFWLIREMTPRLFSLEKASEIFASKVSVLVFSLLPLIDIYPLGDIMHLWWGSCLSSIMLASALLKRVSAKRFRVVVCTVFVPLLAFSVLAFDNYARVSRVQISDKSIFDGMYVEDKYVKAYSQISSILQDVPSRSSIIECGDGAVSVWNRRYLSAEPNFVSWGWAKDNDFGRRKNPARFLIYCADSLSDVLARAQKVGGELLMPASASLKLNSMIPLSKMDESNFTSYEVFLIRFRGSNSS